ncbi:hypothetical protein ACFS07_00255 [Undibacterium arcticum]
MTLTGKLEEEKTLLVACTSFNILSIAFFYFRGGPGLKILAATVGCHVGQQRRIVRLARICAVINHSDRVRDDVFGYHRALTMRPIHTYNAPTRRPNFSDQSLLWVPAAKLVTPQVMDANFTVFDSFYLLRSRCANLA